MDPVSAALVVVLTALALVAPNGVWLLALGLVPIHWIAARDSRRIGARWAWAALTGITVATVTWGILRMAGTSDAASSVLPLPFATAAMAAVGVTATRAALARTTPPDRGEGPPPDPVEPSRGRRRRRARPS